MSERKVDVLVIGAGPAGMLAAWRAAERGCRVAVLEKSRKPGVKILMSGGTRCNLTHDTDPKGILEAFGGAARWLRPAIYRFPPRQLIETFAEYGVATKCEPGGKVFPVSDSAVEVRDALLRMLDAVGAPIQLAEPVMGLERIDERFVVHTSKQTWHASRVVVTVGGQSYPGCGTTGDGYAWMKRFGHTIIPPRPALVPLIGGQPWVHALTGVTVPQARVTVRHQGVAKAIEAREGSLLLTHFGFSGPAAMDVSRAVTQASPLRNATLEVNFVPQFNAESARRWVSEGRTDDPKQTVAALLANLLPRRLAAAIAESVDPQGKPLAELSKRQAQRLAAALTRSEQPITGTKGFAKAEVTAGGVCLSEVNSRTMESCKIPGLYIAGELLNVDGWIGGYNFQSAFSTGHTAGIAAAESLLL